MKITPSRNWRKKLLDDPRVAADLKRRAEAVAAKANSESSWGGYVAKVDADGERPRAVVINIDGRGAVEDARDLRLLRALDAGR